MPRPLAPLLISLQPARNPPSHGGLMADRFAGGLRHGPLLFTLKCVVGGEGQVPLTTSNISPQFTTIKQQGHKETSSFQSS